jgi:hypothetical protein
VHAKKEGLLLRDSKNDSALDMAITNKIGMGGLVALPSCKTLVLDNVLGSLSFWNLQIGENMTL